MHRSIKNLAILKINYNLTFTIYICYKIKNHLSYHREKCCDDIQSMGLRQNKLMGVDESG